MNKIILTLFAISQCLLLTAQKSAPKWLTKSRNAVISITTYDKENRKIQSGTGFFISETGEALSSYTLFEGVTRAEVTDTEGKTYPVEQILGGDELYDVIRFQVAAPKKVNYLPLAKEPVALQTQVYLLPYSTGKTVAFKQGQILEVSKLKESFGYYKVSFPLDITEKNAPLLLENGEVLGLAQESAGKGKDVSYAVSAGYLKSLHINSMDVLNSNYQSLLIKKAWPANADQALVALFLLRNSQNAQEYLETLNDFIRTFPSTTDGYLNRASHYAHSRKELAGSGDPNEYLRLAISDLKEASRHTDNKGNILYSQAKLIFEVASTDTTITDPQWTLQAAGESIRKAIEAEDLPLYHQLQGDINFYVSQFEQAYQEYQLVNASNIASPQSFYMAAQARENTPGFNTAEIIALLDSAINRTGNPPTASAAPYVLERIDWKMKLMLYKEAVEDYNLYYDLLKGEVNAPFYYYREQAKYRADDLQGALADIEEAMFRDPKAPDYQAEAASIHIRLEEYAKAEEYLDKALQLAPEFASCYRLKGICRMRQNKKAEACTFFNKAKELGDPLADRLIKTNCN